MPDYLRGDRCSAADDQFCAEQGAGGGARIGILKAAVWGRVDTGNLRDAQRAEILAALHRHLRRQGYAGKVMVWALGFHLGDALATEMASEKSAQYRSIGMQALVRGGDAGAAYGLVSPDGVGLIHVRPLELAMASCV